MIAGADPAHITFEARRALVGFPPDPNINYLDATAAEFKRGARRRWGASNPQKMDEPFWRAMIVAGVNAWTAGEAFPEVRADVESPIWCAQRFGQSITFLEDGRVIQVGGEHEDGYDPDFCIYNDVFVHEAGDVTIYGYPEQVFPPTDFHTATLMGNEIILIGGLRYPGSRKLGTTTVYSLNTQTLAIRPVRATGESPGWIYRHRAELKPDGGILVRGGTIAIDAGGTEEHVDNASTYRLDTDTWVWERVNGVGVNE